MIGLNNPKLNKNHTRIGFKGPNRLILSFVAPHGEILFKRGLPGVCRSSEGDEKSDDASFFVID